MMPPETQQGIVFLVVAAMSLGLFQGPHSSSVILFASDQGLSVSADNLGAGAEATANEFEQFESALELATTGGRGRCVRMACNQRNPAAVGADCLQCRAAVWQYCQVNSFQLRPEQNTNGVKG
jgi:hypothetical protein